MKRTGLTTRFWLATLALTSLTWAATARAQLTDTTTQSPVQDQARDNDDLNHRQLGRLDEFLDGHPEISEQLRKDPSLINNQQFVANHPELQQYLKDHPEVREDFAQNPNGVMHQEERFDRREDRRDSDVTRGELANMDRFLDDHPEISEQLRKNPSLVDDAKFIADHPALQQFLADHPGVREEYRENPNAFMRMEERYDRREDHREVATMDRFLDQHPEISEQLRKDPALINDKKFLEAHPALQQFMTEHPEMRQEFDQHPYAFMHQEERFDRHDGSHRDFDENRADLSSFHEFLEGHSNVSAELSKNPSLATNNEFLANHTELAEYLRSNPQVRDDLKQDPHSFVKSAQQFEPKTPGTAPKTMPKMPGAVAEPKSK